VPWQVAGRHFEPQFINSSVNEFIQGLKGTLDVTNKLRLQALGFLQNLNHTENELIKQTCKSMSASVLTEQSLHPPFLSA